MIVEIFRDLVQANINVLGCTIDVVSQVQDMNDNTDHFEFLDLIFSR